MDCRQCGHEWADHCHGLAYLFDTRCDACKCKAYVAPLEVEVTIRQDDDRDVVLEEAARHLAGLGRGKYHRVDVEVDAGSSGLVKLDGVELRGVTGFQIGSRVGDMTRITLTLIVSVGKDNPPP